MILDQARDDVLAEVVLGIWIFGIGDEDGQQKLGVKKVDAHGGVYFVRMQARRFRVGRFFLKTNDAPVVIGFNHTKTTRSFLGGNFECRHGDFGAGFDVLLEHLLVIHFVDVIAGKDEDEIGLFGANGINVLVDGVRGALIPVLGNAHLRGEDFDELAMAHQSGPTATNVAIET